MIYTNRELKQSLDAMKITLPNPSMSYIDEIEQNITSMATLKASITDALAEGYIFMDQVHDWLGILAMKNQLVYPLWQQIQQLLTDNRNWKDKDRRKRIETEVTSLEAWVQQIEDGKK